MEWVAGTWALAELMRKATDPKAVLEDVAFALLEANPMVLDVLIVTMTNTPWIGPEGMSQEKLLLFHEYRDARTQLTPDQDDVVYCKTLKTGPLYILQQLGTLKWSTALFAAMRQSHVFPLLIQRFMRIIGREGLVDPKTGIPFEDGQQLGPICRDLVPKLCQGSMSQAAVDLFQKGQLPQDSAAKILDHASEFDAVENFPGAFKTTLASLSHGAQVSKYLSMLNRKK